MFWKRCLKHLSVTSVLSPLYIVWGLLFSLTAALGSITWLVSGFSERIEQSMLVETDQTAWNVFQLETDYLQLLVAVHKHIDLLQGPSPDPAVTYNNVMLRFDLLYSRTDVFNATVQREIVSSDYLARAGQVRDQIAMWAQDFDSIESGSLHEWRTLLLGLEEFNGTFRSLILDALQLIISQEETDRLMDLRKWQSDRFKIIVMLVFVVFAMLATIFLALTLYRRTQSAEVAVVDLKENSKELMRLAVTDPLTGLYTRRALYDVSSVYQGRDALLVWIDVDDFKFVNDTWGHKAGDQLLQKISSDLQSFVNEDSFVFRLGGEEFGIITPCLDEDKIYDWSAGLCLQIARAEILIDGTHVSRTASIGVARARVGCDLEEAFEAADRAMYFAKNNGKNQFKFDDGKFSPIEGL